MTKLTLSFLAGIAISFISIHSSQAQALKPRFGIKAGIDYMTLGSYGPTLTYNSRLGFQGGIYLDLPISPKFSVAPQLLYSQKGGNSVIPSASEKIETKTRIDYADFALLASIKISSDVKFFVGPQLSFLLSHQSVVYSEDAAKVTVNRTDGLRKEIIGVNAGVGYQISNHIAANLHYTTDYSVPLMIRALKIAANV